MRAIGIIPFIGAFLAFGLPAAADPPGRVGRISLIEGAVAFASDDSEKWETASLNYPVTTGDRISTEEEGQAEVHVGSAAIRIAQDSSISFTALDDQAIQIRLDKGSISVRLRRIEPDQQFEIDTDTTSISLDQPGAIRVDQAANGDSTVTARIGEAEVTTGQGSFTVNAGQAAGIPAADPGSYRVDIAPSADAWDDWVAMRDAAEDDIASARYVSREMSGVEDLDEYGTWETLPAYGPCWVPRIPPGSWSPYSFGRWAWVAPWGWTWIDVEPWGFAPFHYGRWAFVSGTWVWAPGAVVRHPVYAPALVNWAGGRPGPGQPPDGTHINWSPLRPREHFRPLYEASPAHINAINGLPVPPALRSPPITNRRPGLPFVPRNNGGVIRRPPAPGNYRPPAPGAPGQRPPQAAPARPPVPGGPSPRVRPSLPRVPERPEGRPPQVAPAPPRGDPGPGRVQRQPSNPSSGDDDTDPWIWMKRRGSR